MKSILIRAEGNEKTYETAISDLSASDIATFNAALIGVLEAVVPERKFQQAVRTAKKAIDSLPDRGMKRQANDLHRI